MSNIIKEDIVLNQIIKEIKDSTKQYIGQNNNTNIQQEIHKKVVSCVISNFLNHINIKLE